MLASVMDHTASHMGSTCSYDGLVSMTRTMANMMMMKLKENKATRPDFCFLLICNLQSRRRGRAITAPKF